MSMEAGIGHNSSGLTDAQERTLFLQAVKAMKEEERIMAEAKGRLGNVYKQLKADLGLTKRQVDHARREAEMSSDDIKKGREKHLKMLRWMAHPIGYQENLFDEDRRPAEDRAFEEGIYAFSQGLACEPPYDANGPQGQKWIEGWHEGQKRQSTESLAALKAELEKNNAMAAAAAKSKESEGGGRRKKKGGEEAPPPETAPEDDARAAIDKDFD